MKNIFVITMIVATFLSFKNAMYVGSKWENDYYNNFNKVNDIDNDPRISCPCPDRPMESCPCDTKDGNEDNVEEGCICPNGVCSKCYKPPKRSPSRIEAENMNKISNMFLQNLWNRVINEVGESVTLHLLGNKD